MASRFLFILADNTYLIFLIPQAIKLEMKFVAKTRSNTFFL